MSLITRRLVVSVLVLSGCQSLSEPEPALDIGTVQGYFADDPSIDAPDTVSVGVGFTVRVQTYGNGCNSAGPTNVEPAARAVLITPYDFERVGGHVCEDYLNVMEHEVSLAFSEPGLASVTVRGRSHPGGVLQDFPLSVWVR